MTTTTENFDLAAAEAAAAKRATDLVDRALAAGADQAEAIVTQGQSVEVAFESGDLKQTAVDEGATLGLRVFKDRRMGFACTNQTDGAALGGLAKDALQLAGFSPADEANLLAEIAPSEAGEGESLVHPSLAGLPIDQVVARATTFIAQATGVDDRLRTDKASLSFSRAATAVASNAGAAARESAAAISLSLFGMAIDGDDVGGFDYWGDFVRDLADLQAVQDASIERYASAALGNLGAGAAESYHGPVLFSPAAFQDVFLGPLVSASSAIAVQRGRSALKDKLGAVVAHSSVTVFDDPADTRLGGATRYDREGVPATRFSLVKDGVLQGYLYNGYAARVDGVASTGHGAGGARAVPGLGPHALHMLPGDGGDAGDLRRQLGRGLMVQRFSGSVDPASGDFSGVAKSARWIEGGEQVRPVRETLFSGNAFDLLGKVLAISSQSEVVMGGCRVPWVLVDGVSVVAG
jgi:PmbA protein